MEELISICNKTKLARKSLNNLSIDKINRFLVKCADFIIDNKEYIKEQNAIDIDFAQKNNYNKPFIDRLLLTDKVIVSMAEGIKKVAEIDSPIDKVVYTYFNKEQNFSVEKRAVPFGVIGIIYEARPNVTLDAFALCIKTKNCVVLKGGKEAINSNIAIVKVIKKALESENIDSNVINLIEDTSRETTLSFMKLNDYIDLLIPRGGSALIKSALENATVPIIETGTGNCHIYIDQFASVDMAVNVIVNAKTQRYGVCNACESLVIHSKILNEVLPKIEKALSTFDVEIRCDERAYEVIKNCDNVSLATEEDFYTEYCAPIISVKTVDSLDCAIEHINKCSTHHTESIITENKDNAVRFLNEIDSACVYNNLSTRFTDGFVFGLGAEIGISTQKLHARGPMGLDALCTFKYVATGNGEIRK